MNRFRFSRPLFPKYVFAVIVTACVAGTALGGDPQFQSIHVDCWTGVACNLPEGYPAWDWSELAGTPGAATTCEFTDPLPKGASIINITGYVWRDICGGAINDSTTLALDLNSEPFVGAYAVHPRHPTCTCFNGWISSLYTLTPTKYKYAGKNVVKVANIDISPQTVRLESVDLDVLYSMDDLQLEARNFSNLGLLETKTMTAQGITANIPLGSTFSLRVTKPGTLPDGVISQWSLSAKTPAPGILPGALFASDILLEFDKTGSPSESKRFFATHLGTENVTMTPIDTALPARTVTVNVYAPRTLGNAPHEISDGINRYDLDSEIVKWSHARGVPPQAVKAIMYNESAPSFNTKTWRYEPLSTDWEDFSPNGANKRAKTEFDGYRMEFDAAHPRGALLVASQDVHPRSIFYLDHAANTFLADADQMVSAYTLYLNNDWWQHWLKYVTATRKALILQDPQAVLDWSAQTTLASSYGLMQVLYEESYTHGWQGISGETRPYYLFDVPANIPDGGSVQTGTAVLAAKFRYANQGVVDFKKDADFDDALTHALSCYNSCPKRRITAYGTKAFGNIGLCMPSEDKSIFN